jgi:hypothetical protein
MNLKFDLRKLRDLVEGLDDLKDEHSNVQRLALNRTIDWLYTRVVRKLADETGMQQKRVRMVVKKIPAMKGSLEAKIVSRDRYTSLKDFNPRQTKKGVVASPWHKKHLFPHTFIGPGGHVYKRQKAGGIKKLFGPAIPKEMIKEEVSGKLLTEAMRVQYGRHLEFFSNRAMERVKGKHGI